MKKGNCITAKVMPDHYMIPLCCQSLQKHLEAASSCFANTDQRTIGPENAHLKPDPGVLSHHEMTLTLNTHTALLNSKVVCIGKVSGLRLQ